jgi:hypothetical protein
MRDTPPFAYLIVVARKRVNGFRLKAFALAGTEEAAL